MEETKQLKVHRVVLLIVDHDKLGAKDVASVLANTRYPNRCIRPQVMAIETREVAWSDRHPLNLKGEDRAEFERLFGDTQRPS